MNVPGSCLVDVDTFGDADAMAREAERFARIEAAARTARRGLANAARSQRWADRPDVSPVLRDVALGNARDAFNEARNAAAIIEAGGWS